MKTVIFSQNHGTDMFGEPLQAIVVINEDSMVEAGIPLPSYRSVSFESYPPQDRLEPEYNKWKTHPVFRGHLRELKKALREYYDYVAEMRKKNNLL